METFLTYLKNASVRLKSIKEVPSGTVLVNKNGTAEKSPSCRNCGPWIHHWEVLSLGVSPEDGECPVCDGITEDGKKAKIVGCHVKIRDEKGDKVYIAPLCQCCNSRADGAELILRQGVKLVWANVAETCSKLEK